MVDRFVRLSAKLVSTVEMPGIVNLLPHEGFIVLQAAHDDAQQIVRTTNDEIAIHHGIYLADRSFKGCELSLFVHLKAHADERGDGEADGFLIDDYRIAADDSRFFNLAHSPQARRW